MTHTSQTPIRVIIADDHLLFLEGLVSILENETSIKIVHQATDGLQVLEYLREHREEVDVVVLDIEMPNLNGIKTAQKLQERYPDVKLLILTTYKDEGFITQVLQAGAKGYILKENGRRELIQAIQSVYKDEQYLDKEVTKVLVNQAINPKEDKPLLTRRETQVLILVGQGMKASQIAKELNIAEATVVTHRNNLVDKLGVKGVAGLVRYAVENGY